jgi:hypothetical protein
MNTIHVERFTSILLQASHRKKLSAPKLPNKPYPIATRLSS